MSIDYPPNDHYSPPPRRMQPGTKMVLGLIAGCLIIFGLLMGIVVLVNLASRPHVVALFVILLLIGIMFSGIATVIVLPVFLVSWAVKGIEKPDPLEWSVDEARQWDRLLPAGVMPDEDDRLLRRNWRKLRGTEFEDFLQEVFQKLGYTVERTRASGDQGIDLILRGKGRRIGVQAKGYSGNVGNRAVQEVHAGADNYGCDCGIVITNSDFTRPARELARTLGRRLIAGREIPDLIQGKLDL